MIIFNCINITENYTKYSILNKTQKFVTVLMSQSASQNSRHMLNTAEHNVIILLQLIYSSG